MLNIAAMPLSIMADSASAASVMQSYVAPAIRTLCAVASLACIFFIVYGGYNYMTSAGNPENLDHAKRVIKNSLLGLIIVIAAATLTTILTNAYGGTHAIQGSNLPQLQAIEPDKVNNGLVAVIIRAITGVLNNIIQSVAQPFLSALSHFTTSTELLAKNSAVFNLWLGMVGIADALFVLVVALIGFHVMSATTFGFEEIEFKHLLPRLALVFLAMNTSIFLIDGIIQVSNVMIRAISSATGDVSIWGVLTLVVKQSGGQGIAALLIMVAFLIFSVILLVYYVGRLITLYIGAVLSPAVLLAWLIPGFRDFSETAAKTYLTTIFVLFVHVVILQLSASLFVGIGTNDQIPNVLMSMVTGLATLIALLKTQSVMMQFSYVSGGARNARKLGGQFVNGVSHMTTRSAKAVATVTGVKKAMSGKGEDQSGKRRSSQDTNYVQPYSSRPRPASSNAKSNSKPKTGTTTRAPKQSSAKVSKPMEKK